MIQKNVEKYASENWGTYRKTITECSKPSEKSNPILECDDTIYCFDDICKSMYEEKNLPASVDGINFEKNEIQFIEFKTGFKDKITREGYAKSELAICERTGEICEWYWGEFFKRRDKEKEELISSLKIKALDTYLIFDKRIFPSCDDYPAKKVNLRLIIVLDVDPLENMEETLEELAGKEASNENWVRKVKQSLKRFLREKDAQGQDYLYDCVEVYSVQEYYKFLSA